MAQRLLFLRQCLSTRELPKKDRGIGIVKGWFCLFRTRLSAVTMTKLSRAADEWIGRTRLG